MIYTVCLLLSVQNSTPITDVWTRVGVQPISAGLIHQQGLSLKAIDSCVSWEVNCDLRNGLIDWLKEPPLFHQDGYDYLIVLRRSHLVYFEKLVILTVQEGRLWLTEAMQCLYKKTTWRSYTQPSLVERKAEERTQLLPIHTPYKIFATEVSNIEAMTCQK